jgi:hypothetical protein
VIGATATTLRSTLKGRPIAIGGQGTGATTDDVSISGDGRYVAFSSFAANSSPETRTA